MDKDFLNAGNPGKIATAYARFLAPAEVQKIRNEARLHVAGMYELGVVHYRFAISVSRPQWRQKISRLYYASYNVSKAVRFDNDGNHSTDPKDHSKVGQLPNGFPNKARYENELKTLREDRNSCDYDHMVKAGDLVNTSPHYASLVRAFMLDAYTYLSGRGVALKRGI